MEKAASIEIDLEEWEVLSDDHGFHGFDHDSGKSFSANKPCFNPKGIVDVNYFICSPQPSRHLEARKEDKHHPIGQEPIVEKKSDEVLPREFKDICVVPPVILADRDVVSQVFFKKLKDDEFADMKVDSPKSNIKGIVPQIDMGPIPPYEKEEVYNDEGLEDKFDKNSTFEEGEMEKEREHGVPEAKDKACSKHSYFTIWKWRLTGIGGLCSIGVAAATLCIFILGSRKQQKQEHHRNQKLQFQIYADEKRIKQVVQQAARLNQALSPVRGAPMMTGAHISFGGYYDEL